MTVEYLALVNSSWKPKGLLMTLLNGSVYGLCEPRHVSVCNS